MLHAGHVVVVADISFGSSRVCRQGIMREFLKIDLSDARDLSVRLRRNSMVAGVKDKAKFGRRELS